MLDSELPAYKSGLHGNQSVSGHTKYALVIEVVQI